ncbi:DEAD/DEAH box helicase [Aeromicrobium sp. S22]|uniref:helicase-related protein n=1 Tax=Aeromicrobium sp. S22 TaxID=2662029 RepID=UPI00129DBFC1|nr:helicase-related protein [Aeromicrobium sp. S22]MRK01381.1 DEAD/DEAH box helicase [Aeromicrobium sp. S22]
MQELPIAPGSIVVVRDEEWLVTQLEPASDGTFVHVQGLTELVRDTEAIFSTALDTIEPLDPAKAEVVGDDSPAYRRSRLWLESTMRKTSVPLADTALTVATRGLADTLDYQLSAVRQALDPDKLRPRILLADAVGLGKTLEIGMILSELVRRGRGERILVVTPKHVLEQMQFELWTRFALPFVRLDSTGIQRIRQKLPANRNPFAFYKRIIVSIDTLKSDRYLAHLEKQHWDAVVIDESHNVTNSSAQNNRLARLLATRSDALILASATPHNGKAESFAELIRMLEPSAVTPDGELVEDLVRGLVIRRHRHSPEVSSVVGADWAERLEPENVLVPASAIENEIADELDTVWLYPETGTAPYSGANAKLFPWTLAKAFLSSPAALAETVKNRVRTVGASTTTTRRELDALARLGEMASRAVDGESAKYDALVKHLRDIGVGRKSTMRAVVFAERVPTLHWLRKRLATDLKMSEEQIVVLHGQLSDEKQQAVVESFKQESSPIRVLVTGDVASEGVNLHLQCHHLIHFDIPWSLIRIEQRNGRIDRYGQKHRPRITTLLLNPTSDNFAGDIRVLKKLMEKEHEAHRALGDAASLMGKYDVDAEERAIIRVLAEKRDLDAEIRDVEQVAEGDDVAALLARLMAGAAPSTPAVVNDRTGVYATDLEFLRDALDEVFITPSQPAPNGVAWKEHGGALAELTPSVDLAARLSVLPQSYLSERRVNEKLMLATSTIRGNERLLEARSDDSSSLWPDAHYLSPLHPVLDWASDRALASLARNQIFAVRSDREDAAVLIHGSLTNKRGQVVASSFLVVSFPDADNPAFNLPTPHASVASAMEDLQVRATNTGAVASPKQYEKLVSAAVAAARNPMADLERSAGQEVVRRVQQWQHRAQRWEHDAEALVQHAALRSRRSAIAKEQELAAEMLPAQLLVRPLLVTVGGNA